MADSTFPSRRSSIASRRSLQRRSSRLSQNDNLIDIFGDENAADFMPVADGFRPASSVFNATPTGASSPPRPSTPQMPPRAASPPRASEYLKKRIAGQERPSSVHRSSLSGPQRESFIQRIPSVSAASESTTRPLSVVSTISVPSSESSFIPTAGPSHAYASYPQVSSLNRHASTSTVQTQNRPYTGPSRPTHPYAMYPQIPVSQDAEPADPFADPADIANVGFPGLQQNYARVRAADGEDADDLIGPDGHTEQLPPYTLYPAGMPAKVRREIAESPEPLLAAASSSTSLQPEEPLSEPSAASSLLDNDDGVRINVAAARAAGDDDRSTAQKLKEKSQRRTCWGRVPVWVWIAIVVLLCITAAVLGGAVGTYFARHHPPPSNNTDPTPSPSRDRIYSLHDPSVTIWQTVTTTLIDAVPLSATPTGLPPLPHEAHYGILLDNATNINSQCTDPAAASTSWQCSSRAMLNLSITHPDGPAIPNVQVTAEYPEGAPLLYGAQAPSMMGPANLTLATDIQDQGNGPAFFFQQLVDKLIIIKDNEFPIDKLAKQQEQRRSAKRWSSWLSGRGDDGNSDSAIADQDGDDIDAYLEEQESIPLDLSYHDLEARHDRPDAPDPVLTGDSLWFCFWNQTILEGFIYITKPNQQVNTQSAAIATIDMSNMNSEHGLTAAAATPTGNMEYERRDGSPTSPPSAQQTSTRTFVLPSPLPYSFKIEERRGSPNMPRPYCQRMYANHSGQIVKASDNAAVPSFVSIIEKQLIPQSNVAGSGSKRSLRPRQSSDSSCKCIWRVG